MNSERKAGRIGAALDVCGMLYPSSLGWDTYCWTLNGVDHWLDIVIQYMSVDQAKCPNGE